MRITNPRFRLEKKLGNIRILRRGIPYDEIGRKEDLSDRPEHGVGLFFISYQNSISNFETIQTWAGGGNVIMHPLRGVDGIAGQGTYDNQAQDWPKKWDSPANGHHEEDLFMHVVTLLGGEYFFTPSLPFLANLK
jgi:deferrochelatase/peroxidase EfeB